MCACEQWKYSAFKWVTFYIFKIKTTSVGKMKWVRAKTDALPSVASKRLEHLLGTNIRSFDVPAHTVHLDVSHRRKQTPVGNALEFFSLVFTLSHTLPCALYPLGGADVFHTSSSSKVNEGRDWGLRAACVKTFQVTGLMGCVCMRHAFCTMTFSIFNIATK